MRAGSNYINQAMDRIHAADLAAKRSATIGTSVIWRDELFRFQRQQSHSMAAMEWEDRIAPMGRSFRLLRLLIVGVLVGAWLFGVMAVIQMIWGAHG